MEEVRKDIIGYEGVFEVNKHGQVFSKITGKLKKAFISTSGYPYVNLNYNGLKKNYFIHRLIMLAFAEPIPGKSFVNHIDGNKQNYELSNLEWVTRSENMKHADRTGLRSIKGENNVRSILTNEYVLEIRRMKGTMSQRELATKFKVSRRTIQSIQYRKMWTHI